MSLRYEVKHYVKCIYTKSMNGPNIYTFIWVHNFQGLLRQENVEYLLLSYAHLSSPETHRF